jgi:hypothetical protein
MARRLWGCYSVADHLEHRAFVADLLLYDRLVVPVPSDDDMARWEERWDPERQARLLEILGGFVERVEWSGQLREQFELAWSTRDAADQIASLNEYAEALEVAPEEPWDYYYYSTSRVVLTEHMARKVLKELRKERGDVRAVAVYAKPDRFDREWELTGTPPFLRRVTRPRPGVLREVADPAPLDRQDLAKVVITRLVVPDEGKSDEEVLKRTVDLISRDEVPKRRAAFHGLLASLQAEGLRDDTVVGEIQDLLDAFNESIRRHSTAWRMRTAVQLVTTGISVAALWAPPVGLATGPVAAIGETAVRRRLERSEDQATKAELDAVALLAEAQLALGGKPR